MEEALLAIIALINGEFDNPHLMGFGPLPVDRLDAIKLIAEAGIEGENSILDGTEGQDRESYSDEQDRESYTA